MGSGSLEMQKQAFRIIPVAKQEALAFRREGIEHERQNDDEIKLWVLMGSDF